MQFKNSGLLVYIIIIIIIITTTIIIMSIILVPQSRINQCTSRAMREKEKETNKCITTTTLCKSITKFSMLKILKVLRRKILIIFRILNPIANL